MSTIIRCANCFTYVYADARSCHGCGERLGRRKLLRGGSWLFIVLAVGAFTIARGIDLSQERAWQRRTKVAQQGLVNDAQAFVAAWLQADTDYVQRHLGDREVCPDELSKVRARYPNVLPADAVVGFRVTDSSYQEHVQVERGRAISHQIKAEAINDILRRHDQADYPKGPQRVSCAPKTRSLGTFRRSTDGVKRRSWTTPLIEFEVEFRKDGAHYTLLGNLCIEDGTVSCFKVDHIRGIEGEVEPTE